MKKGWEYRPFTACLAKIKKQKQVKAKDYQKSGLYPIVSQEAELISGYSVDDSLLFHHDKPIVIFGDHTKIVKYIDFDFVVGADGTQLLCPKDDIISKFFYYALRSIKLRELGYARHFKLLKEHSIPVPPLAEQEEIVRYLDAAFAKIDALKKIAEQQLTESKSLFQKALSEYLSPKKGWEEKKLGETINHLRTGLNPRVHFKLNTPDAEGYYITVRELKGFSIEPDNKTDRVNDAAIRRINERSQLKVGDVLFSGTGTIGKTALVTELPKNWNIKEGVYAMSPQPNMLHSRWFIYYISSEFFLKLVNDKAAGTGVRSIPMKELVKLPINLPPLPEQQAIVEKLDAISERCRQLEENYKNTIALCDDLKQKILKQVFE